MQVIQGSCIVAGFNLFGGRSGEQIDAVQRLRDRIVQITRQPLPAALDQFAAEMDDFAECILAGRQSRVSGEEGRRDLRIMTAIYESAASGRAVRL